MKKFRYQCGESCRKCQRHKKGQGYDHKRDRIEPASGSLYSYTQNSNPEG